MWHCVAHSEKQGHGGLERVVEETFREGHRDRDKGKEM